MVLDIKLLANPVGKISEPEMMETAGAVYLAAFFAFDSNFSIWVVSSLSIFSGFAG
jgi:hypothetical protein